MKQWIRILVIFTIIAGFTSSAIAAPLCQIEGMLDSAQNSSWNYPICYVQLADHIDRLGKPTGPDICHQRKPVIAESVNNLILNVIPELRRANDTKYEDWLAVRSQLLHSCDMVDSNYYWSWNKNSKTYERKRYANQEEKLKKQLERETIVDHVRNVLPDYPQTEAWQDIDRANQHTGMLQGLLDKMLAKAQSGQDLQPFIELIVNEGTLSKQDPRYVSDNLLNTAFYLYAYSLPSADAAKLTAYTTSKYNGRVRYAAASAAAEFAVNYQTSDGRKITNTNPSGRLAFTDIQRRQVAEVLATVDKTLDKQENRTTHLMLLSKLARLYEDPGAAVEKYAQAVPISEQSGNNWAGLLASGSLAMVVPEDAATTALAAGAMEVSIAGLFVYSFYKAFEDSGASRAMQRAVFENKMLESLSARPDVTQALPQESIGEVEDDNSAVTQAVSFDAERFVEEVNAAQTAQAVNTKVQNFRCVYEYVNHSEMLPVNKKCWAKPTNRERSSCPVYVNFILRADPGTQVQWNNFINYCADTASPSSASVSCKQQTKELMDVWKYKKSFKMEIPKGTNGAIPWKLFVRAVYRNGHWIPDAEFSMTGGYLDDLITFTERLISRGPQAPQTISGAIERIVNSTRGTSINLKEVPSNWWNQLRDGKHVDSNYTEEHFHVERMCSYTPGSTSKIPCATPTQGPNDYVCNLSMHW